MVGQKVDRTGVCCVLSRHLGALEEWRATITLTRSLSAGRYSARGPATVVPIDSGHYTLEVDGTVGMCKVEVGEGELIIEAIWLDQEHGYLGFDVRPWSEWSELMDSKEEDSALLTLNDGRTQITYYDLRSIRSSYPHGPMPGLSEMTISRLRRFVVLRQGDEGNLVHVETGQPLAMRGSREFHSSIQIDSLAALEAAVDEARSYFGSTVWWRGHARSEWNLVPAAHRENQRVEENWFMAHFIQGFQGRMESRLDIDATGDVMMLAQHHHLPTRLLDWSESALIALYFAVASDERGSGSLWALSPYALNEDNIGERYVPGIGDGRVKNLVSDSATPQWVSDRPKEIIAFHVPERYPRMVAQLSRFTIHGHEARPMDVQVSGDRWLRRYQIAPDAKKRLRRMLWLLGMRRSVLFPDLDNLALDIRETNLSEMVPDDHRQRMAEDVEVARSKGWIYQNPFESNASE